MAPLSGFAHSSFHLPQPWRSEAVVDGREEHYNDERFVHEFSYRHAQRSPDPTDEGISGTAGSVSGDRLYYDFRYMQSFPFSDSDYGFLLDIQRSEDFDGAFDRQLIGFTHQLTDDIALWLQGDVTADKANSDVYASLRTAVGDGWVRASWILSDATFNDKTSGDDRFRDDPHSYFLQWHRPGWLSGRARTTISATYSPEAVFDSRSRQLVVSSKSFTAALSHEHRFNHWRLLADIDVERTRRHYQLDELAAEVDFTRDYYAVTVEAQYDAHRLKPTIGARYLMLDEKGFLGRELNFIGSVQRREPMLFGSVEVAFSPSLALRPAVYLAQPDTWQMETGAAMPRRDTHSFVGKLALPLEILISPTTGAVLTIAPTVGLHDAAFGGGNVQLHWPL